MIERRIFVSQQLPFVAEERRKVGGNILEQLIGKSDELVKVATTFDFADFDIVAHFFE